VKTLLSVQGLRIRLPTAAGLVTVVDGIDYEVEVGQVFGIAGESGSGKTISVLALLGLLPEGAQVEGTALFDGQDLLRLGRRAMRDVRGVEIAMVFQDPMTSLHPMMTIERQLTEHVRYHLLNAAKIQGASGGPAPGPHNRPDRRLAAYPHRSAAACVSASPSPSHSPAGRVLMQTGRAPST
jgi:ABC-type dipeptide/oligopeptide/nickel transport system ATPase component